jgi:penicillin-binding protein 2
MALAGNKPKTKNRGLPMPWTRARSIALVFLLMLGGYGVRLYDLQIRRFESFKQASLDNFRRENVIRALRGNIYTRDGVLLAKNELAVDLVYSGGEVLGWERIRYLAGISDPILPTLNTALETERTLASNLPPDRIAALEELTLFQPSLELRRRLQRIYPQNSLAGNLLGYTSEANRAEVDKGNYALGDLVGRSGIESSLDDLLQGKNGRSLLEVNASGRLSSETVTDPGRSGQDLYLTIDSTLQKAAEKALADGIVEYNDQRKRNGLPTIAVPKGAIIALDPRNGEVLAMASSPPLNPNWFSTSPRPKELVAALTGESGALSNRAVSSYTPGSVFKPTSTNAFLERWGNRSYNCAPGITFGGRYWRNWNRRGMGVMDGRGAIANSCNTWFYQAAIGAGLEPYGDALAQRATEFGFGQPTGLELSEDTGLVPSHAEWDKRGWNWFKGFTLNYAIGQGALLTSPAQIARALTTIINEGNNRPLTLVRKVGSQLQTPKPTVQVSGKSSNWNLVKEGMQMTVQKGTSSQMLGPKHFPIVTGGKTGTAQAPLKGYGVRAGTEHSWYEGYGPVANPDVVVVAFFEHAGEGSAVALPAVRRVMAAHWNLELDSRGNVVPPKVEPSSAVVKPKYKKRRSRR